MKENQFEIRSIRGNGTKGRLIGIISIQDDGLIIPDDNFKKWAGEHIDLITGHKDKDTFAKEVERIRIFKSLMRNTGFMRGL